MKQASIITLSRVSSLSAVDAVNPCACAVLTGFLVSVFLLPCTSGPYIVVIGMLSDASSRMLALGLILLVVTGKI